MGMTWKRHSDKVTRSKRWLALRYEAKRRGKGIDREAVGLLVDMVGNDLGKLHNEMDKLAQRQVWSGRAARVWMRHSAPLALKARARSVSTTCSVPLNGLSWRQA